MNRALQERSNQSVSLSSPDQTPGKLLPRLTNPRQFKVSPLETALLQNVHRGSTEIILEKEFDGGYSGTRVFLILPMKPSGTGNAQVVTKVGSPELLRRERDNYQTHLAQALPFSTTQVRDYYEQDSLAALNYIFVGGDALGQTLSLEDYYQNHTASEVIHMLTGLLDDALGQSFYGAGQSKDFFYREEYGQHLAAEDEIKRSVQTIFPSLQRVNGDQLQLRGLSQSYPNPLESYSDLLDTMVKGRKSLVHGDLHLRNVLVDQTGKGWLIDFAKIRERHNLFDFIKLETYLRFMALANEHNAFSLNDYAQFEQSLNAAALGQPTAAPTNDCLAKAYEVLSAIRQIARNYMRDPRRFKEEYLTALMLYCLKVMKYYQPVHPAPTQLVFLTACVAMQCLQASNLSTAEPTSPVAPAPHEPEAPAESQAGKYKIHIHNAQGITIGDQARSEQYFVDQSSPKKE
jgi:hypothetical protein